MGMLYHFLDDIGDESGGEIYEWFWKIGICVLCLGFILGDLNGALKIIKLYLFFYYTIRGQIRKIIEVK
jgi:hypothetical protein